MAGKERPPVVDVGLDREIHQGSKCRIALTDGTAWNPVNFPVKADNSTGFVSSVKAGVWFLSSGRLWYGTRKLF